MQRGGSSHQVELLRLETVGPGESQWYNGRDQGRISSPWIRHCPLHTKTLILPVYSNCQTTYVYEEPGDAILLRASSIDERSPAVEALYNPLVPGATLRRIDAYRRTAAYG